MISEKHIQTLDLELAGHKLVVQKGSDVDSLWEDLLEGEGPGSEDRIPYWTEIWPCSVVLAEHLNNCQDMLRNKLCLEVGCGLGVTSMVAAKLGARVMALDIEWHAVYYALHNAILNNIFHVQWVSMDWKQPSLKSQQFDFIWAGDVLYEKRFALPLASFLNDNLAPGGKVWIADQDRNISQKTWPVLFDNGFQGRELTQRRVQWFGQHPWVRLVELTRK